MNATTPGPTLPNPTPTDNPNPTAPEEEGTTPGHNGGDDDDGNGHDGGDPTCAEIVEELLARAEHMDALATSAMHLIGKVPRIGTPEGERAFSRLGHIVENLAGFAEMQVQYAEYALSVVGDEDDTGGDA